MKKMGLVLLILTIQALMFMSISSINLKPTHEDSEIIATVKVEKKSYPINVQSIGELESACSASVACSIRSDQAKIIDIIQDGTQVNTGDLLVKIDPTYFEKKIEELHLKIVEGEGQIESLVHAMEWEIEQAEHDKKGALLEAEAAEMEVKKIMLGDGPLEIARLKAGMQKAEVKFNELNSYRDDLKKLEDEGYLNPVEVQQTLKKIQEEQESFESAKLQYTSYVDHVYPMQIKKAETYFKKATSKQDEVDRSGYHKIKKAHSVFVQAQQQLVEIQRQLNEAKSELLMTEIRATSPGMVVLREEFRLGQKRKPRVGDVLVRNQPILDLPDLSRMIVKTKVREVDLYKIEVGKLATIEIDAYPNLHFEGKVSFIGILAMSDMMRAGDEKNFEVKIELVQSDSRLRPGMTARVNVHAGDIKESLSIPVHAVFENNKNHFCYLAKDNGFVVQPIKLGKSNDYWVEVKEGLQENAIIALSAPSENRIIKDPFLNPIGYHDAK